MNKLRWTMVGIAAAIGVTVISALTFIAMPGSAARGRGAPLSGYRGSKMASALLRVPVTGIFPGGAPTDLNTAIQNPLASDPDAPQRGMKDFDSFNCSGCHAANGGGGMGPALSDAAWIYGSSAANIYLSIAQGRPAGMPAFGAMLPDRTIWELVAYIQGISAPPVDQFGATTSAAPAMPSTQQVPAGRSQSTTPWQFMEPRPAEGARPGG
jgi:cytochrome c oxidase cbb3-type subunit 3